MRCVDNESFKLGNVIVAIARDSLVSIIRDSHMISSRDEHEKSHDYHWPNAICKLETINRILKKQ